MQPHDNNQRPEESNPDGGRDTEQAADKDQAGLVHPQNINPVDGAVYLTANIEAGGGLAG